MTIAALIFIIILRRPDTTTTRSLPRGGTPVPSTWRATCPICFWEDDLVQLRWPDLGGGANGPSLIDAQANFAERGAMEERFLRHVRAPAPTEQHDPEWRPFDPEVDTIEGHVPDKDYGMTYVEDRTAYYYWRVHPGQ